MQLLARPFLRVLSWPKVRYSSYFNSVLRYTPREEILDYAMDYARHSQLAGDYLEFGVWEGNSFIAAFHLAQRYNLRNMKFYAFDSFQGLPEIKGVDALGFRHFSQGQYTCSMETFKRIIARKNVDLKKVVMIPGWFDEVLSEETAGKNGIQRAAVVFIDSGLYESAVPVLDFLTDLLEDGAIIISDNWFCFRGDPGRGEHRAFAEWLQRNPELEAIQLRKFGWSGNSFIIRRRKNL